MPEPQENISEAEYNKRYGGGSANDMLDSSPAPMGAWQRFVGSLKENAPTLAGAVAGPVGMYAASPAYRKTINENLPALAGAGAAAMMPGAEEFAPGIASMSPVAQTLLRLGGAGLRASAAYGGATAGGAAKETLEGKPPTSLSDISRLSQQYGVPQGAIEGAFNIPGALMPAPKFANKVYRATFRPNQEEINNGVLKTLQDEKIPTSMGAQEAMAAKHAEVNKEIDNIMASHANPGGQRLIGQGPSPIVNRDAIIKRSLAKGQQFVKGINNKEEYINELDKELRTFYNENGPQIDFNNLRQLKTDMRRGINYNAPLTSDRTPGIRKMISQSMDEEMEVLDPRLTAPHERLAKIIDAEKPIERFTQREAARPFISSLAARPLVGSILGGVGGMYTLHDPIQAALTAGAAGLAANPSTYGWAARQMKNNPELIKQLLSAPFRFGAQQNTQQSQDQ